MDGSGEMWLGEGSRDVITVMKQMQREAEYFNGKERLNDRKI